MNEPTKIKKGDIITMTFGAKDRPFVIVKVMSNTVYALPMSTKYSKEFIITTYNSRFSGTGYLCNSIIVVTTTFAKKRFSGILDDARSINRALHIIKKNINKL